MYVNVVCVEKRGNAGFYGIFHANFTLNTFSHDGDKMEKINHKNSRGCEKVVR